MNIKKIIVGIVVLGIIGAFVVYKTYNKPHVDVSETSADVTISANRIMQDFSSDENTANTNYLDKIILVKGIVSETKIENKIGIITLKTDDDFGSVQCHLSEEATKEIGTLKQGQTITVKGICTGYLMDVILVKSEIIN
jgi:DNA/RNA endonuclease YhcR with UshA esterase domain